MTKQEIITEFEKKFIHTTDDGIKTIHCGGSIIDDINLFLFQALTEFEQAVREEIYKRGYADGKNEQPYGINKDVSIN